MLSPEPRSAGALSPGRRRSYDPTTEPPELSGMVQRVLRSLVRRCQDGDIDALAELVVIRRAVDDAEAAGARGLLTGRGQYSWGEIGRWLGVSRQAVRQRYGPERSPDR